MVTIYGSVQSRTATGLWTARELGLDFTHKNYATRGPETQSEEYLALNPTGKVPTLVDGDLVLTESAAICFYLARQYGNGKLLGDNAREEGKVMQWVLFAMTEIDPFAFQLMLEGHYREGGPNEGFCTECKDWLSGSLKTLDKALEGKDWLMGDKLTLADIIGIQEANFAAFTGADLSPYANVQNWIARGTSRPAHPNNM
ncbi:glutathione S-transferase family protein [Emcibacter sp.]|uniref:glutathione S-transferase family protein n=1 Tax=Emcibacter sp. TaxID=1979954 RepID=UPI002AA8BB79|nr:glutathione S-transferase family protein [Emcibacter sp.]